ncbi:hybrid sensor histidine kinase/response regulator [Methylobacterium radiodurans]|uniref:Chemotaxis protein CheA n=1 Tax=Methylobacterium radiodurans TaxID=2202828 RepID=A0A2U8VUN1_9HYPH|nr:response regulator [Methylobacterium radiodurans]AWN37070.1 hybrid sensor histidine kinase/response regulator [Methylobacterium radiodurans]
MADIRQLLLAAFEVEHREHIEAIRAALGTAGAGAAPDWNDIFRRAHSLKGAARAVDLPPVEALAHRLETLFERVSTGAALDRAAESATQLALDRIEAYVAAIKEAPDAAMPGDALAALDGCLGPDRSEDPASAPPAEAPAAPAFSASLSQLSAEPSTPPLPRPAAPAEPAPEPAQAILRVPAETVEALSRASHDLTSALGGAPVAEGLARIARACTDLRRRVGGLAGAGQAADDTAGEAARAELRGLDGALAALAREAGDLARRHAAAAAVLDGAAARVRAEAERLALVPAETVLGLLARTLRETAREQGRDVAVATRGLDVPVDRAILQSLKDPVLHALRNALSHGWEPPEVRAAAGKPEALQIGLEVALRGGRLVLTVWDDGRGPDLAAIAAQGRRRGLLVEGETPDPDALLALVFEPGFSTASSIDTLAGRGFGLSVVADAARALQGSVRLGPRAPAGSQLVLSLPLAASRRSLLLVEAGGATYALPGAGVARLLRVERAGLPQAMGRTLLRVAEAEGQGGGEAEASLPVAALSDLLNLPAAAPGRNLTAVLLRAGGRRLALAVERLHDVRTLLVLPVPPVGADPDLVAGTAILAGDVPVLVLDPEGLAARADGALPAASTAAPPDIDGEAAGTAPRARRSMVRATILVVDDSITTRTLEKGILEAAGYRVVVCVDGQDALDRLRAEIEPVDLVLADVEMPRLDGFGLLRALRADERFRRLPTVLMTSRGDPEDVARGLELGADAYLTKQKFDQSGLLETIGRLL